MPAGVVLYLFRGGVFVHLDFLTLRCSWTELLAVQSKAVWLGDSKTCPGKQKTGLVPRPSLPLSLGPPITFLTVHLEQVESGCGSDFSWRTVSQS